MTGAFLSQSGGIIPSHDPTEILYENEQDDLSVYFNKDNIGKKLQIIGIQCFGLVIYNGKLIMGQTSEEIESVFGKPDEIDYEGGAFFNDETERETICCYDNYGVMAFFRGNHLFSAFFSPKEEYQE